MDLVPLKPAVLACRTIARADAAMAEKLGLSDDRRSLGLLTCTSDDALYVALDEGTKAAPVEVVYAKSFYAGANYPSGPLSGEAIGIYAASDPAEIEAALARCRACLAEEAWFYAADERGKLAFFPHVIRATGSYLSAQAGIERGSPMAYLIAPPLEAVVAVDAALKAAPVKLGKWIPPPSETNFAGAFLTGELHHLEASRDAFVEAVASVSQSPLNAARRPDRLRR